MKGNGDYDETNKRIHKGCMRLYYQPGFNSSIFGGNLSVDAVHLRDGSSLAERDLNRPFFPAAKSGEQEFITWNSRSCLRLPQSSFQPGSMDTGCADMSYSPEYLPF